MGTPPEQLLRSLRDVQGVTGSFIAASDGRLLFRDMPAYFQADALAEVAPRAARIFESWSLDSDAAECVVRFAEHKLYVRRLPGGLLCALLQADVHMPSMRTAVSLVSRHLAAALAALPGVAPAGSDVCVHPPGAADAQAKRARIYRGRRIAD